MTTTAHRATPGTRTRLFLIMVDGQYIAISGRSKGPVRRVYHLRPGLSTNDRHTNGAAARAAATARHPDDAGLPRRGVGARDPGGRLRAGVHERVRRIRRPARHARRRTDLVRGAGGPGAEHLPRG